MDVYLKKSFSLVSSELGKILFEVTDHIPYLIASIIILFISCIGAYFVSRAVHWITTKVLLNKLLENVVTKLSAILVLILGSYAALRTSGLTQLAMTILGGTGLAGIIFGFAFRDIAENFLSSILLSIHRPFKVGDVIEVDGEKGVVERMTVRCTVLMNFDGDHIQIPNSLMFKSKLRNLTSNRNQRQNFLVGVGYEASLSRVQSVILEVLRNHPALLKEPSPTVLVENLGAASVNIRVLFWVDIIVHDPFKTRSSVVRLVKLTLEAEGISMPDEAREVIFPQGVPVYIQKEEKDAQSGQLSHPQDQNPSAAPVYQEEPTASDAEENLKSDKGEILQQIARSASPEEGGNILD